jgi:glycine/D-amino acid oxidase-like deaminating enzyme
MQSCPQALYALGYGANGITFGAVAARVLRDLCLGNANDDPSLFRLDR